MINGPRLSMPESENVPVRFAAASVNTGAIEPMPSVSVCFFILQLRETNPFAIIIYNRSSPQWQRFMQV